MLRNKASALIMAAALTFTIAALTSAILFSQPAVSQGRGPFALSGGNGPIVWRIDQSTGQVSYCYRGTPSEDMKQMKARPPYCSAWSQLD